MVFSQRYKDLIQEQDGELHDGICGDDSQSVRSGLVSTMLDFREPQIYHPNRYDYDLTEETDALLSALARQEEFLGFSPVLHPYGGFPCIDVDEERISSLFAPYLFDLIELQYDELSDSPENGKRDFQAEINTVLRDGEIPWLLVDGRMVKIDSKQFEQDMKRKAAERLSELKDAAPVFQSSYNELVKAIEFLDKGDFAEAVTNAAKSYESALKVLCNEENTTPDKLTKTAIGNGLFGLPDSMKPEGFQSQVLMSLPFIRNRPGAAHGAGAGTGEISRNMANLAVNLACALDTYIADEWTSGQQEYRD